MALGLTVTRLGDIRRQTEGIIKAGRQAHTTEVKRTTTLIKNAEQKIVAAGLGSKSKKTVQSLVFPSSGTSMNAAGSVYSKFIVKHKGGLTDILTVFRLGATITGNFLFVGRRVSGQRGTQLGELKGKRIAKVRTVTIRPRLQEMDAAYLRLRDRLPDAIAATYQRLLEKVAG